MQTQTTTVIDEKAETIASKSPEGAAANPTLSSTTIYLLAILFPISALLISLVAWALFGAPIAFITLAAGLILTIGVNPTLWALRLRARERKRIELEARRTQIDGKAEHIPA